MIVAAPPGHERELAALAPAGLELEPVAGGETRAQSVANALALVDGELVAVHDAARPLVSAELVDQLIARLVAAPEAAGVIAATPIADTVKRAAGAPPAIVATESRDGLWAAQTPQVFRTEVLRAAHAADRAREAEATDDAFLVEARGATVLIEPAPATNLKVTTAADLWLAELLLGGER